MRPVVQLHVCARAACVLLAGASAATPALAQAPAATTPSAELGGYRLPLLREGSVITRVVGDLAQDPDEKLWLFRPLKPESGGLRRELVLLPSPTLEDMLRVMRLSPAPVEFEVTGRVFIYRGRNFLLAELAPPIVRLDVKPPATPAGQGTGASTGTSTTAPAATASAIVAPNGTDRYVPPKDSDDAAVDEIERRLEERVGRAPARMPDLPATTTSTTGAGTSPAGAGTSTDPTAAATGDRLVLRRGRLMRDPQSGSWRFVPAQTSGRGDPSLEILPCLLLEKLELAAREGESSPEILVNGTVVAYDGRQYLLPTSFRRAREGRGLGSG